MLYLVVRLNLIQLPILIDLKSKKFRTEFINNKNLYLSATHKIPWPKYSSSKYAFTAEYCCRIYSVGTKTVVKFEDIYKQSKRFLFLTMRYCTARIQRLKKKIIFILNFWTGEFMLIVYLTDDEGRDDLILQWKPLFDDEGEGGNAFNCNWATCSRRSPISFCSWNKKKTR